MNLVQVLAIVEQQASSLKVEQEASKAQSVQVLRHMLQKTVIREDGGLRTIVGKICASVTAYRAVANCCDKLYHESINQSF